MVINNLKFLLKTVTLALVLPMLNMSVNGMNMNPRNLEENYNNNNNIGFTYDELERINIVAKEKINDKLLRELEKNHIDVNDEVLLDELFKFNYMKNPILNLNNDHLEQFDIKEENIKAMIANISQLKNNIKYRIDSEIPEIVNKILLKNDENNEKLCNKLLNTSDNFNNVLFTMNNSNFTRNDYDLLNNGFSVLMEAKDFLEDNNINQIQNIENQEQNNKIINQPSEIQNNIDDKIDPKNSRLRLLESININNSFNLLNNNDNIDDNIMDNGLLNHSKINLHNSDNNINIKNSRYSLLSEDHDLDNNNNENNNIENNDTENNSIENNNIKNSVIYDSINIINNDEEEDNNVHREINNEYNSKEEELNVLNDNNNIKDNNEKYFNDSQHVNKNNIKEEISDLEACLGMKDSFKTMYIKLKEAINNNKKDIINNIISELRNVTFGNNYGNLEILLNPEYAKTNVLSIINDILNTEIVKDNILFDRESIKTTFDTVNNKLSSTDTYGTFNKNNEEEFRKLLSQITNKTFDNYLKNITTLENAITNLKNIGVSEQAEIIIESLEGIISNITEYLKNTKENNINNWETVFKQAVVYNNENSSLNKVLNVNLKELSKTFNGIFDFNKMMNSFYEFYNKVLGKNFENLPIILSSSDTENLNYIKSILKDSVVRDTLIAFNVDSNIKNMTKEFVFEKLNGDISNIHKTGNITTYQNQIREYIANENTKNQIFIDSISKINVKNSVAQQIRNIISNYLIKGVYKYTEIKFRKLIDKPVEFLKDYYNK